MKYILFLSCLLLSFSLFAKDTKYTLTVARQGIKVDNEKFENRILVNGSLPAPTLEFTEGDTAVIKVINNTDDKTLIHWHGLLIKNDQDGVPYVNSLPIEPHSEKVYRFK